jgi:SAM-dependent methyltransferase
MTALTLADAIGVPEGEGRDSLAQTHAVLERWLPKGRVRIYEAGGGSTSYLPASLIARAEVTVVDIDPVQLDKNTYAAEKILGDVQAHAPPAGSVDLVTCYNVIEHLPDVGAALDRFAEACRPGGLLLIGAPNPASLSGVVTRFTPHAFHVWYYRRIMGRPRAGEPGEPPFRTFYHPLVHPDAFVRAAEGAGFELLHLRRYESPRFAELRQGKPALALLVDAGARVLNALLLGRVDVRHGDYHLVLKRRG